jgi:hypothetical protein
VRIAGNGVILRSTSTSGIKTEINVVGETDLGVELPPEKLAGTSSAVIPEQVLDLSVVTFKSISSDDDPDMVFMGLIAEDVAEKFPEAATRGVDGEPVGYDTNIVMAGMLAVIQRQQKRLDALEQATKVDPGQLKRESQWMISNNLKQQQLSTSLESS